MILLLALALQDAPAADEIVRRSLVAFHYAGGDMKARVSMELVDRGGGARRRVLTMLRRDHEDGGDQKYFIYFHEPGDVRGMTFMVWKYPDREDDRWIFIPSVDLVRRIAAQDKRSSFVGSDFTYEDISGRDVAGDRHALLRQERQGERDCYVVESVPDERLDYVRRVSWIDRATFLPIREEFYDAQEQLSRVFTADEIRDVGGVVTVVRRTMENVKTGHRTAVAFDAVEYDLGLADGDFSERSLRRPPREWIR